MISKMKKIFVFLTALLFVMLFSTCTDEDKQDQKGGIHGIITDKATGEPIRNAGVQLNNGMQTITGSEGQYEFIDLEAKTYKINVTKTGYASIVGYSINVEGGKTAKGDIQIEKLPAALKLVDNNGNEIDSLDFGSAFSDITRSFGIFNDGESSLDWQITETAEWITNISKTEGILNAGSTQSIIVTIDRNQLIDGENTTNVIVTSNNGSKDLLIKATENRQLPTLNTLEATNITSNSAKFNGTITNAGQPSYTERGFVYSTSTMPTIETAIAKLTAAVNSTTNFSANVTGLQINRTYYVRAYAKNSKGTAYSTNEYVFQTIVGMPQVTTQTSTNRNVANSSITFNGTITNVGDPAYTERGFVYATTHNPTITSGTKKVAAGSGTGAFSVNATGIAEDQIYYVRAYATNVSGTAYGTEVSFDFNVIMPTIQTEAITNKNIGAGTATFNGNITSIGDLPYTEKGFVYATVSNPTIDDEKKTVSGTVGGTFSRNITGLQADNIYYIRAFVTNSKGTIYGSNVVMDFNATLPQVTTQSITNKSIGNGSATFNGTIVSIGDPAYTQKGFVYGLSQNPNVNDDTKKIVSGSGTGAFSSNITGLLINNTYYVRTYATNIGGTSYGTEMSFNMTPILPSVITDSISNISATSATLNGNITNLGDPTYTERGFVYSTLTNPTISDTKIIVSGSGTGTYSTNATGLTAQTTYYVRAYAKNIIGTIYGNQVSFTPHHPDYTILTTAGLMVANMNASSYQLNWSSANSLCQNSILAGYTDWRLPTISELSTMYTNRNLLQHIFDSYYWSSTVYNGSSSSIYVLSFSNGDTGTYPYYGETYCRCVRTITSE